MRVIPKYFVGGVSVTTPILPSVAQAIEQQQQAAQKSSDSESGSKKSYIEQIFDPKAQMLASDATMMASLAESVGELEANPIFQSKSKAQQFATVYKKYITMSSMARSNYENLMSAKQHILNNGASEETAFTTDGHMFVHQGGEERISIIHPSQFNRKEDIPVTNAELLYLRANDPKMAFNDVALTSLTAATSMKEIRDIIDHAVKNLGSEESDTEHFINPALPNSEDALKELAKANITQSDIQNMDIGTLLKVKVKNKSNAKHLLLAIRKIETQLNPQQRALLQLRAKEIGGKTTAESIIAEYINSMLNTEHSFTLGFEKTATASANGSKSKTGSGKEESLDDTNLPPVVEWMAGRGEINMHRISNGSRGSLFAPGNEMTITHGNQPSGIMNLYELGTSSFAGALKLDQATVGGVTINMSKRQHVLVDGNAIYNIPLPVDQAALMQNIVRPDFDAMDRFSLAWKELKSMGIDGKPTGNKEKDRENAIKINQILQKYQLPGMYSGVKDGMPVLNLTQYQRFGVINGYVDGAVLGDNATFNSALEKVEGNEAEAVLKQFKAHYKGYKGNERGGFLGLFTSPDLFKAAIFIPIRQSYVNAYAGSGRNLNAGESSDIIRRENDLETRPQVRQNYRHDDLNIQY